MPLSDSAIVNMLRSRASAQKVVRLYPATALRLADALIAVAGSDRMVPSKRAPHYEEFPYALERWSADGGRLEDVLARFKNAVVARSAFPEAARMNTPPFACDMVRMS